MRHDCLAKRRDALGYLSLSTKPIRWPLSSGHAYQHQSIHRSCGASFFGSNYLGRSDALRVYKSKWRKGDCMWSARAEKPLRLGGLCVTTGGAARHVIKGVARWPGARGRVHPCNEGPGAGDECTRSQRLSVSGQAHSSDVGSGSTSDGCSPVPCAFLGWLLSKARSPVACSPRRALLCPPRRPRRGLPQAAQV